MLKLPGKACRTESMISWMCLGVPSTALYAKLMKWVEKAQEMYEKRPPAQFSKV